MCIEKSHLRLRKKMFNGAGFMLKTMNTARIPDIFYMLRLKGWQHDAKNLLHQIRP